MKSIKFIFSWISLFFVVVVGIFIILYLACIDKSFRLFASENGTERSFSKIFLNNVKNTSHSEVVIPTLSVARARYDNQRTLRIYDFYFTGSQWESLVDKYDICFATHASIERIYWLPSILERWTGPLSIGIHLISEEEWLIFNLYMSYLSRCHSTFINQVAIHLAVPANISALKIDNKILSQWKGINLEAILEKSETCPEAEKHLKYLLDMLPTKDKQKLAYKELYPQNHIRNLGRKGCGTHWTFSTDVDIIPSNGMADLLQRFYNDQKIKGKLCAKCAYIVPTFELNDTYRFPESKKRVAELFNIGATQPFHINVYKRAQEATEYEWWISNNLKEGFVTVSHKINETKIRLFEPFYVSADNIAPYDERFFGYGYTRSSQFKTAVTSGWKFSVLTPIFSIHWGLQTKETYESPKLSGFGKPVRAEQVIKNRYVYKRFLKELGCKKEIDTL